MSGAPSGVPDLGASSQAGCRLSLGASKSTDCFCVASAGERLSAVGVVYIRGAVASSMALLLLLLLLQSLKFHSR